MAKKIKMVHGFTGSRVHGFTGSRVHGHLLSFIFIIKINL